MDPGEGILRSEAEPDYPSKSEHVAVVTLHGDRRRESRWRADDCRPQQPSRRSARAQNGRPACYRHGPSAACRLVCLGCQRRRPFREGAGRECEAAITVKEKAKRLHNSRGSFHENIVKRASVYSRSLTFPPQAPPSSVRQRSNVRRSCCPERLAGQLAQSGKRQRGRMHESPATEQDHGQSQVPPADGGRRRIALLHRGSLGPCRRSFGLPAPARHHLGHP
jgi:hypothetical protein